VVTGENVWAQRIDISKNGTLPRGVTNVTACKRPKETVKQEGDEKALRPVQHKQRTKEKLGLDPIEGDRADNQTFNKPDFRRITALRRKDLERRGSRLITPRRVLLMNKWGDSTLPLDDGIKKLLGGITSLNPRHRGKG